MTLIVIFSHTLTQEQIDDAKKNLNIENFTYLPHSLAELWSQIPTHLDDLDEYLTPIYDFLNTFGYTKAYVLVQGDFGATYLLVNYVKKLSMIPIYSTTARISNEKIVNGNIIKTSQFKHILFRKYAI